MKNRLVPLSIILMLTLPLAALCLHAPPVSAARGASSALSPDSPMGVIKNAYNALMQVLNDPSLKGEAAREKRNKKISELTARIFDFRKISLLALGRNARKFTKQEFDEFARLFSRLLENTYISRLEDYADARVKFDKQRILNKKKAIVDTIVTYNGKDIPISYRMYKQGDRWRGYDVLVEGVSLIKNYRTQFNELLSKDKPAEVIKIVKKRLDEQKAIEGRKESTRRDNASRG